MSSGNDIEFTVGLDTSPAEQRLSQLEERMSMADKLFDRMVSDTYGGGQARNNGRTQFDRQMAYQRFSGTEPYKNDYFSYRVTNEGAEAYRKFALQQERSQWKRAMNKFSPKYDKDTGEMEGGDENRVRSAAERFAEVDKQLRMDRLGKKSYEEDVTQEDVTGETKAQNREYNDQLMKLGKMALLLKGIKDLVRGIIDLWKKFDPSKGNNIFTTRLERVNIASEDRNTVSSYATDRLSDQMMAGMDNLGASSPIQKGDYSALRKKIQSAKESAMQGGAIDTDLVRYVQWLSDATGSGYNAENLLVGDPNRSITEIANQIIEMAEKHISSGKFDSQSEQKKNQDAQAMRYVLGDAIYSGIYGNAAKNKIIGSDKSSVQRILDAGFSGVYRSADSEKNQRKLEDSAATRNAAVENAVSQLSTSLAPVFVTFDNAVTRFSNWVTRLLGIQDEEWQEEKNTAKEKVNDKLNNILNKESPGALDATSSNSRFLNPFKIGINPIADKRYKNIDADKKELSEFELKNKHLIAERARKGLKNPNGLSDFVGSLALNDPAFGSTDWNNFYYEGSVIKSIAKEIVEKGFYGKNGVPTHFDNKMTNEMSNILKTVFGVNAGTLKEDEILSFFTETFSSYSKGDFVVKEAAEFYNKYFGEGGVADLTAENINSFYDYADKVFKEDKERKLAYLTTVLDNAKGKNVVSDYSVKKDDTNNTVTVTVNVKNLDGSTSQNTFKLDMNESNAVSAIVN